MQYTARIRPGLMALVLAGATTGAQFAYAAGTASGEPVQNSVTLDYTVNGGSLQETTDTTFVVDRKLSLVVASSDLDYVSVTSGQEFTGQTGVPALVFTVENTGNSDTPQQVLVGVADKDGTAVTGFTGTPSGFFDPDALLLAVDTNGNGLFDDGTDTVLPAVAGTNYFDLGGLDADTPVTVLVVADVPSAAAAGENATVTLVAAFADGSDNALQTDESGNVSPSSTSITPVNNVDDPAVVQNVFADIAGADPEDTQYDFVSTPDVSFAGQDAASNGQHSDSSSFIVNNVQLQVAKILEVIYDPISGNKYDAAGAPVAGVNPKSIPGAVIMYVIGMQNAEAAGGVSVEGITLADNIEDGATVTDLEPIDEGNQSGAAVNPPASVTIDVDAGTGTNNRTFTFLVPLNLNQVNTESCDGTQGAQGYSAGTVLGGIDTDQVTPEISFAMGDCAPQEDGYVIYFTTVNAL